MNDEELDTGHDTPGSPGRHRPRPGEDAAGEPYPPGTVVVLSGTEASRVSAALADLIADHPDVAVAPREHGLIGALSARENVLLGMLARRRATPDDEDTALRALTALGVPDAVHDNLAEQLSGGQQQRVAVARALVSGAPVVALDDPVSELDDRTRHTVLGALRILAPDALVVVALPDDGGTHADEWVDDRTVRIPVTERHAPGRHAG